MHLVPWESGNNPFKNLIYCWRYLFRGELRIFPSVNCNNCQERWRVWDLTLYKLTSYSFMEQEARKSWTRGKGQGIPPSSGSSQCHHLSQSPSPRSQSDRKGAPWYLHVLWVHHKRNPELRQQLSSSHPGGSIPFIILDSTPTCSLFQKETSKHPWKDTPGQRQALYPLARCTECEALVENCLPIVIHTLLSLFSQGQGCTESC